MAESAARKRFRVFSERVAHYAGSPVMFSCAVAYVGLWLASGPYFGWSEAHWKALDIVVALTPFWMVFILQATQNRDSDIVEAKLDELLKAIDKAKEDLVGIQRRPEKEVEGVRSLNISASCAVSGILRCIAPTTGKQNHRGIFLPRFRYATDFRPIGKNGASLSNDGSAGPPFCTSKKYFVGGKTNAPCPSQNFTLVQDGDKENGWRPTRMPASKFNGPTGCAQLRRPAGQRRRARSGLSNKSGCDICAGFPRLLLPRHPAH